MLPWFSDAMRCGGASTVIRRSQRSTLAGNPAASVPPASADDADVEEALGLLRAHPAMDEARAYVVARATEAKALLEVLPETPVRTALESFADLVATRTG